MALSVDFYTSSVVVLLLNDHNFLHTCFSECFTHLSVVRIFSLSFQVQLCAAAMAPSHFILVLCTRFGVLDWFDQKRKPPVVRDDDNRTADLVQVPKHFRTKHCILKQLLGRVLCAC